ncbi:unnamed protein product, partial [Protopolystoma xenopodis]
MARARVHLRSPPLPVRERQVRLEGVERQIDEEKGAGDNRLESGVIPAPRAFHMPSGV